MESKYNTEMEEHKQKLDKEYETTRQNFTMELEKLKRKMVQDLEKRVSWCCRRAVLRVKAILKTAKIYKILEQCNCHVNIKIFL